MFCIYSFIAFICFLGVYSVTDFRHLSTELYFDHLSPKEQFLQELQDQPLYKITGFNFQPTNPGVLPYDTPILEQLNKLVHYDPSQPIPKTILQMWKVPLDHEEFPKEFKQYIQTWRDKSPEYDYHMRTNAEIDVMIEELYKDIPQILHAYNILPEIMLKCDFSIYLLLFAYGGTYVDLDAVLLKPMNDWISSQKSYLSKPLDLGIIVGVESDRTFLSEKYHGPRVQINTWTISAKKGHPMLAELISNITEYTLWREETGTLNTILEANEVFHIINWTGPGKFTHMVYKALNNILQSDFNNYETLIDAYFFGSIRLPIVIGDIMVLPVTCLHAEKNSKWKAGNVDDPLAYVKHIGSGVWKKKKKTNKKAKADSTAKNT
ncbi:mannosyltransferase [Spathaspora passalidarum NRRL Y-27907]|uniref:Mannosyltransferase n=1 Tax=Spathaspora passalidarum (strain NRRL Y-27907 / 11-Y1) TaxID=619300 RepID=G3AUD3_SPAPN|nr:mannosyltransferase [Spathaspora passalidarum NRRL Y-27907]EGW30509.1 mannosyltransferase [Spathaspora passalidarum NRRL Y-27907]